MYTYVCASKAKNEKEPKGAHEPTTTNALRYRLLVAFPWAYAQTQLAFACAQSFDGLTTATTMTTTTSLTEGNGSTSTRSTMTAKQQ